MYEILPPMMDDTAGGEYKAEPGSKPEVARVEPDGGICLICEKTFSSLQNAMKHFRTVHTRQPSFLCKICDSKVKNKYCLRDHMWRTHKIAFETEKPKKKKT